MNEDIICILKWKNFTPNVSSRVSDVFTENSFCDVTLVSDDQKPFQSKFSSVLKNILLNNHHPHPLIYSILQFIFLGKASVNRSNTKRFAQAAKDLQIKKLAENIIFGNPKIVLLCCLISAVFSQITSTFMFTTGVLEQNPSNFIACLTFLTLVQLLGRPQFITTMDIKFNNFISNI